MTETDDNDAWTLCFRALSSFGPAAVCALFDDARFSPEDLRRQAPRELCSRGDTLLTRAARLDQLEPAAKLLDLGADLEWPTKETDLSPLQVACHCGHADVVKFFLGRGASITRRNNRGLSAVSTAVHTTDVRCLDILAKAGADLRSRGLSRGNTLAQSAASRGNLNALAYLASKGVNLFERDYRGATALDAAAKQRGVQSSNNPTLDFLHEVLRVGGGAASIAWTRHQRLQRRLPVIRMRALVVRGRAVARRGGTRGWRGALAFLLAAPSLADAADSEDEADEAPAREGKRRASAFVCTEGPFRHVLSYL